MLRDIIEMVLPAEGDIEVVAHADTKSDLHQLLGRRGVDVDVVIMGLDDVTLPEIGRELFPEHPFVTLLGMVAEGKHAFLYELRPHCVPLGAVSPEGLASAIRETTRGGKPMWTRA